MRRFVLAGMFLIALFSMLCIGFILGAFASPLLNRVRDGIELGFNRAGIDLPRENRQGQDLPLREKDRLPQVQGGVSILSVESGSPAEQAGLEAGEIITAVNGEQIDRPSDLASAISSARPGDTVTLEVTRADQSTREVSVKLDENPEKTGQAWLGLRYGPSIDFPDLPGDNGDNPERQPLLPRELPFDKNWTHPGALISEVISGSPADKAGLKVGQMIQAVDGETLNDPNRLPEIIAGYKVGDTVTLSILDPGQTSGTARDVQVVLGENPDKAGQTWLGIRFATIDMDINPEKSPEG